MRIKEKFSNYDSSVLSLIAANVFTIGLAVYEHWSLGDVLTIYWCQNIIIGFFTVLRILSISFALEGRGMDGRIAGYGKFFLAGFFVLHYGLFHFGYFEFLRTFFRNIDLRLLLIATLAFFLNHLYSFLYHKPQVLEPKNLQALLFAPYRRIVPMHMTILFGFGFMLIFKSTLAATVVLVFFLILKTVADVSMHIDEHRQRITR